MFEKLKQLKELRDQAKVIHEMLSKITVTEREGDVSVTVNGNMEIISIEVSEGSTAAASQAADWTKKACNAALQKAQREAASTMRSAGGLNLGNLV